MLALIKDQDLFRPSLSWFTVLWAYIFLARILITFD